MLKITFLGTGTSQGIPVIGSDHPVSFSKDLKDKRLRSSILVQHKDISLVGAGIHLYFLATSQIWSQF